MAHLHWGACCGVAEVVNLSEVHCPRGPEQTLKDVLDKAKRERTGMLTAYFVKYRNESFFQNPSLYDEMVKHGFQKLEDFENPNTGNTIRGLYYILKPEETIKWTEENDPQREYEDEMCQDYDDDESGFF